MPEILGNTFGNIQNYGLVVKKDEWIYYSIPFKCSYGLFKIKEDGTCKMVLSSDKVLYINIKDDWIYYLGCGSNSDLRLRKIKTDGSCASVVGSVKSMGKCVYLVEDWLYGYSNVSTPEEPYYHFRIKTNNKSKTKLISSRQNIDVLYIKDDWIYYEQDSKEFLKMKLDGSEKIKICDGLVGFVNIVEDWIYYLRYFEFTQTAICKMKLDGSCETRLTDTTDILSMNISDGWIYYGGTKRFSDSKGENSIYKIKLDGTCKTKICNDPARYINMLGDWIYYQNNINQYMYRIKTDGSNRELIDNNRYMLEEGDNLRFIGNSRIVYDYTTACDDTCDSGVFTFGKIYSISKVVYGDCSIEDDYGKIINFIGSQVWEHFAITE